MMSRHSMSEKPSSKHRKPGGHSGWAQIKAAKIQILDSEQRQDLAGVTFHAGETFKEVILLCVHAANDDPDHEDLKIQKVLVNELRDCRF